MANTDAAFGLRPVRTLSGAPFNGQLMTCSIAASLGADIGPGSVLSYAGSATTEGVPTVTLTTDAAANCMGVCVGLAPDPGDLSSLYFPTGTATAREIYVCTDPLMIYHIQEDSDGGALAATDVGNNADFINNANVDADRQMQLTELDSSSATTTAALELKILGLARLPGNIIGNYAIWEVMINEHTFSGVIAGI